MAVPKPSPSSPNVPVPPPGTFNPSTGSVGTTQLGPPPVAAPVDPNARPAPGAPGYDLWAVNDMLRANGYEGWQMTGVQPIQTVTSKANPLYDATNPDPTVPATINTPENEYVVNIRNPKTNEIKQVTLSKVWQGAGGGYVQDDPGNGSGFGYQMKDVKAQQVADKVGHTDLRTIGDTIYGTNSTTGAFEAVPGAPKTPGSWSNVRQVENADGSTSWIGEDPSDHQIKKVPGMPELPAASKGWGDPKQIEQADGSKVWYGTDPTDRVFKAMPGMPTVPRAPTGPTSITGKGGTVYVQKPDGTYAPASGVPDPNPPKGTQQVILGPDGFLYRQTSRGDGTFDPDTSFAPVPFTDAAKQARANIGATHTAGEPGTKVINGLVYHVTYRGGSDDAYDVDTSQPATPMPGATQPTSIATSTDQPQIVQRMPNGSVQSVPNPNYQPTDPAQRAAQLSQMASSKLTELQAKIGTGGYDADRAQQEFDTWWDSTIEPAKAEIKQAQQQKQIETQLKLTAEQRAGEEQQRSNYATALTAGSNAVEAAKAQMPYMVGPGFGAAMNNIQQAYSGGKAPGNFDIGSAVTFQMPDLQSLATQATNQALAHLSPTAASGMSQATGTQANPGLPQQAPSYDYTQAIQRNRYQLPGATTTVSPDGTVHVQQSQGSASVAPAPSPSFTPPGGSNYAYPTSPWSAAPGPAIPNYGPSSPAMAPYQLS
jgi:hypothetical protein